MECMICLSCEGQLDFQCPHCTCACHQECMKRWWSTGVGCPQCRQCGFKDFVEESCPSLKTHDIATTAMYMYLFYMVVALPVASTTST